MAGVRGGRLVVGGPSLGLVGPIPPSEAMVMLSDRPVVPKPGEAGVVLPKPGEAGVVGACADIGDMGEPMGEPGSCEGDIARSCRKVLAPMGAVCRFLRRMKAMACRVSSAKRLPLSWQSISEWFA